MKEMTSDWAIEILHPDTSAKAIAEIEYYAGLGGKQAVRKEIDKACLFACDIMEKFYGKKESYIDQIRFERDIAIAQLNDYGVQFGEKADCVRVVRCKDCAYKKVNSFSKMYGVVFCKLHQISKQPDDFCSYGEPTDGD